MAETFEEYRDRVLGYLGDLDPITVQQQTPERLAALLKGVPAGTLGFRPAPRKWCIHEIVVHMADAELAMGWRLRNMLASPGVQLPWFDQDVWSEALEYRNRDLARALELFGSLRRSNLELLLSMPRSRWDSHHGVHSLRGRQTVAEFVRLEAAHDLDHLQQIERILAGRGTS